MTAKVDFDAQITNVCFMKDTQLAATTLSNGTFEILHMDGLQKKGRFSSIEDTVNTYGTETGIISIGERSGINVVDVFEAKSQTHKYKLPPSFFVKDSAGFSNYRTFCLLVLDENDDTSAVRLFDLRTSMKQSTIIKSSDETINSIKMTKKDETFALCTKNGIIRIYDVRNSSQPIDVAKVEDNLNHMSLVNNKLICSSTTSHFVFSVQNGITFEQRILTQRKKWIYGFLPGTTVCPLYAVNGSEKSSYVYFTAVDQLTAKKPIDTLVYKAEKPVVAANSSEYFLAGSGGNLCQQLCDFELDLRQEYRKLKDINRKHRKNSATDFQEQTRKRYEQKGIEEGDRGIIDNDVKLDDIVIKEEIGSGTFGQVRVCESKKTGQLFAVKILPNTKAIIAEKHLLEREIAIQVKLLHENVVQLITSLDTPSNLYIIFELMECSLREKMEQVEVFNEMTTFLIMADLSCGLDFCHTENVIHRDIKPENCLYGSDGLWKLGDFGLSISTKGMTKVGTESYQPPEILDGKTHSFPVDIWSLGCVFYECLEAQSPFPQCSTKAMIDAIMSGNLRRTTYMSEESLMFAKEMLTVDPKKRLSAMAVSRHPWMKKQRKEIVAIKRSKLRNML
ncbi:hypothetical protein GCK72_026222 [Caenorhabditis remanei]|uniref:Protein kinase domain-containing protein n=1 Tax=Caenorhabditis remanei TaxID=31234 RepID=A0A6A5G4M1_CAERE|nr:hypothetical protein GCK72_026222 [Caenorhabditis remanei]KAF1749753.1 hypothetical protein GCK72_026222 [Caenorhabditis remanei]